MCQIQCVAPATLLLELKDGDTASLPAGQHAFAALVPKLVFVSGRRARRPVTRDLYTGSKTACKLYEGRPGRV